jgi:integrase/recombinase XerD
VRRSHPPGPALVAAEASADPVTLLVLGWLATKRSEHTRTAYARDIGISPPRRPSRAPSWLTWCREQEVHPVTGVTVLHVARYARQLETAGLSPASAARTLAAVSSWYTWLARRGHIPASPAVGLARPRAAAPSTPPAPRLTPGQALALVHAADTEPGPQRARTAALVAVLLFTGARLGEVIGANVADLGTDRGHRVLWVNRGNRRQGLPLPGPAASRIEAYLAGRVGLTGDPVLFATATGRRLFGADVRRTVRRLATRADLPADLTSHLGPRALRHSYVTLYLQAGGSLRDLRSAMGHADPRTADQRGRVPL